MWWNRLAMATFLASLDGTIIATALPKIASDFSANKEMSWVATAYLLTFSRLPQFECMLCLSTVALSCATLITLQPQIERETNVLTLFLFDLSSRIDAFQPLYGKDLSNTHAHTLLFFDIDTYFFLVCQQAQYLTSFLC